jgi:methyl-accepting chemotaxis protein
MAAASVSSASSGIGSAQTVTLLVAAVTLSGALAFVTVRELRRAIDGIIERMASVEKAAKENLVTGLNALSVGDLTVKLQAKTQAAADFSRDELGRIMRQAESVREAMIETYGAYNLTVDTLSSLIGEVRNTAGSVDDASHQMSSTSEEAGKATGEIAHAIGEVAEGAERQVQMVDSARRAIEEVAAAVNESAAHAEQTAEVATRAKETAKHGVDAAEQANEAMRSVRDSSEAVSGASGSWRGSLSRSGRSCRRSAGSPNRPTCWHSTPRSRPPARASRAAGSRSSPKRSASWPRTLVTPPRRSRS